MSTTSNSPQTLVELLSLYRGIHARVAAKLGVDPSYVSRVASGSRKNADVERALLDEIRFVTETSQAWFSAREKLAA